MDIITDKTVNLHEEAKKLKSNSCVLNTLILINNRRKFKSI